MCTGISHSMRDRGSHQLSSNLGHMRIICASNIPTKREEGYQPGSSILTVVGPQCGRMANTSNDPWGRFCLTCLKKLGKR